MIKKILCLSAILLLTGVYADAKKNVNSRIADAKEFVWLGLDYSMVKMIGNSDFLQPDSIFPGMFTAWNNLFLKEVFPRLQKQLKKEAAVEIKSVTALNKKATADQIVRKDGSEEEMVDATHITTEMISAEVKKYTLPQEDGLGLVFIMDRLVKKQQTGCLYQVWFDVGTREVVDSQRGCYKVGGIGFRNYWFTPVKIAVKKMK